MRILAVLVLAVLGCKDKAEPRASASESESSASASSGGVAPTLAVERDRFGNIPGRVDDKQRAARKQRLGKTLLQLDTNGDRKVTVAELQDSAIQYLTFDDPEAVDSDGDGEISVEEIDVALDERRARSRERWKTEIGR